MTVFSKDRKGPSWRLEQWIKKLKCSGATGTEMESFSDINVGVDPSEVSEHNDAVIWGEDHTTKHWGDVEEVIGSFDDKKLSGRAKIKLKDGKFLNGYFKSGVLHGFARYFDRKGRLRLACHHRNGRMVGTCWKIIRGGGCVVGQVDSQGELTGDDVAYIYPDHHTALLGSFSAGLMVEGVEHVMVDLKEDEHGVKIPVLEKVLGSDHVHKRQIGEYNFICKDPTAPDPYESKMVGVRCSSIPGADEGLFARCDIETGTTIAFYNGSRADPQQFDPSTWETNNYRIFDPADMPDGTIDIPVWAQDTKQYCGSLAHKCNHSFTPNGQFVVFDHPKFGLIPCVSTISDIQEGEEITVGYGYELEYAPDWYRLAWENSLFGQEGV